ncbi:carotenoid oxygenase family protein [Actinomadura scrupuli]|uniref:carotenoid oxygenase family protein n=1 Tax=Actinomadura scrupuli TaxID=559629 RepID=UPI003D98BFF0
MADRHLEGLLAPVTEEVTAYDLPVSGRIPAGLHGRYLRNGPNPLGLEDPEAYHLFLGDGMVHGVRLRDGKAEWYRNRWVRSRSVSAKLNEPWPAGPVFQNMDWAPNTHVIGHAGRTFALVEAGPRPYELSYELDTLGPCDFGTAGGRGLPGGYTAHTKRDPLTGDLHAIAYFFGWEYLQHVVVDAAGAVRRTVNIPVSDGPMVHDFALTQRYVVVYDLPITFSLDMALGGSLLPYAWNDAHPARIGLLPKDPPDDGTTPEVTWFDIDPCFVFHTLNAYDDGDRVVVDLAKFPRMLQHGRLEGNPPPVLDRWTIDPVAGKVLQETLDDRGQEFPRVDERVVSVPHRYGYTVSSDGVVDMLAGEAMLKRDYSTGSTEVRPFPRGSGVGEAVFAPAAPDAAEDDGYVMAFVFDPARGATDLVIVAARDFTGEPVAVVHLPVRVPMGFHGSWVPDPWLPGPPPGPPAGPSPR